MRLNRFFSGTFKGNYGRVLDRQGNSAARDPSFTPFHTFKEPDQFIEVVIKMGK
jgi:hypothetical protein